MVGAAYFAEVPGASGQGKTRGTPGEPPRSDCADPGASARRHAARDAVRREAGISCRRMKRERCAEVWLELIPILRNDRRQIPEFRVVKWRLAAWSVPPHFGLLFTMAFRPGSDLFAHAPDPPILTGMFRKPRFVRNLLLTLLCRRCLFATRRGGGRLVGGQPRRGKRVRPGPVSVRQ